MKVECSLFDWVGCCLPSRRQSSRVSHSVQPICQNTTKESVSQAHASSCLINKKVLVNAKKLSLTIFTPKVCAWQNYVKKKWHNNRRETLGERKKLFRKCYPCFIPLIWSITSCWLIEGSTKQLSPKSSPSPFPCLKVLTFSLMHYFSLHGLTFYA